MDNNNQPNPYATPASDVATPPPSNTAKCPGFVKAGIILTMAVSVITLISNALTFDTTLAIIGWEHRVLSDGSSPVPTLYIATIMASVLFVALYALFCWLVSKRKNWARIVLLVFAILGVTFGIPGIMMKMDVSLGVGILAGSLNVMMFCGALCLFMPVSNAWFRKT